jgi:hypothetical protein
LRSSWAPEFGGLCPFAGEGDEVTEREKLKREIYVLGQIIKANVLALASKSMNDQDRELLQRQMATRTAHQKLLQKRLDRLSALTNGERFAAW